MPGYQLGVQVSITLGGSKVGTAFHIFEFVQINGRNYWEFGDYIWKIELFLCSGSAVSAELDSIRRKGPQRFSKCFKSLHS